MDLATEQQELAALGRPSRASGGQTRGWAPDEVLEITRTFAAPATLVYRMWSQPEHLVRWLPEGTISLGCEVDFREGGAWRQVFGSSELPDHRHVISGTFREIDPPHRLSMTYVNDYDGVETLVTAAFRELGNGTTEMVFRQVGFPNVAERDGHGFGWQSSFDVLVAYIAVLQSDLLAKAGEGRRDGVAEDFEAARKRQTETTRNERGTA